MTSIPVIAESAVATAPRRSNLFTTFAVTTAAFFTVVLGVLLSGASAEAATYSATTSGSSFNWSNTAKWSGGPPGTYPGQTAPGDVATISGSGLSTITVDVAVLNGVTLNLNCSSCTLLISNPLALQGTSSSVVAATISIDSTLSQASGATLNIGGPATLNSSGTLANGGSVNVLSGSTLTVDGGTISGTGLLASASTGAISLAASQGPIIISGQTIDSSGVLVWSSPAAGNTLSLTAATVNVAAGTFTIASDSTIIGSAGAVINLNGGVMTKSSGSGTTSISAVIQNSTTVTNSSAGILTLSGGGTHNGTFDASSGAIELAGNHALNAASSLTGSQPVKFSSGTLSVNATIPAVNFIQMGGTITGSGMLDVSNSYIWSGGSMSGGNGRVRANSSATLAFTDSAATLTNYVLDITSGATLDYNSAPNALTVTTGGVIDNNGTFNYSAGANELVLTGGGELRNQALATFTITANQSIQGTSSGLIVNSGSFRKGGTGSLNSDIVPALNNSGSMTMFATGGNPSFTLKGGGTHTGTFSAPSPGSSYIFAGGTHVVNSGTVISGAGSMKLTGGTLQVNTALTTLPFSMSGGTLTGSANVTIPAFTWTGGAMSGGPGQTLLSGTSAVTGSNAAMTISGRTVVNNGTLTYAPVNLLQINNGGMLKNSSTMDIAGDSQITSDNVASPMLDNAGTLTKSGGTGLFILGPLFINSGTLNVNSGGFRISNGGTNSGTLNLPGAANVFTAGGGTFTLNAGTNIPAASTGIFAIDAGATVTAAAAVNFRNVDLSGTLNGTGDIVIGNSLAWKSGTISGLGAFNIPMLATVDQTATTGLCSLERTTSMSGTWTYDPANSTRLQLANGKTMSVFGTFNITNAGNIGAGPGSGAFSIQSPGVFKKSGGAGGTRIDVPVNTSTGTISSDVAGQSLILAAGGGLAGGSWNTGLTALLDLYSGAFNLNSGSITGSGTTRLLNTATLSVQTSTSAPTFNVEGGTLTVNAPNIFTIAALNWLGGTINGNGRTNVTAGAIVGSATAISLSGGHTLANSGAMDYMASSPNFLTLDNSTLRNEAPGTFTMKTDSTIGNVGTGSIVNLGTFVRNSSAGVATINPPLNSTSGTLSVATGTLKLRGTGTITSAINVASGATLEVNSGTTNINAGATYSGTGTLHLSGGNTLINVPATVQTLDLTGGTLGGSGNLAIQGGSWQSGIAGGSGTLTLGSGGTVTMSTASVKTIGRPFVNNGTVQVLSTTGALVFNGAISNSSLWNFQGDPSINGSGSFTNLASGLLTKSGGTAGTGLLVSVPLNNDGSVQVTSGAFHLLGGGTHNGSFSNSTTLTFQTAANSFTGTSSITGNGLFGFTGPATVAGTYSVTGHTALTGGGAAVAFNSTASTKDFGLASGASLLGSGNVTITGTATLGTGTLSGPGTLTLAAGSSASVNGGAVTIDGKPVINGGTFVYLTNNPLSIVNGASFTNNNAFSTTGAGSVVAVGSSTFTNNGTFTKSSTNSVSFGPVFNTAGQTQILGGTISFTGGYSQSTGLTSIASGATLGSPTPVLLGGGVLAGNGTISGPLTNNGGQVKPGGVGPGKLTVTGNTILNGGSVELELSGTNPGVSYDQLDISGSLSRGGVVNVSLINGFTPANANVFDVIKHASAVNGFDAVNLPSFTGGSFAASINPTELRLTATIASPDISVTQSAPPTANAGQNVPFIITVTNGGAATATSVSFTSTFSGGTFVSATSAGSCSGSGPVICNLGSLAAGASTTVTLTLNATAAGSLTNSATATTAGDANSANDSSSATVIVSVNTADLAITKGAPATAIVNNAITYTITVTNNGAASAANVVVNDPTPDRLRFLSNRGDCNSAFPCNLGTLLPGESRTIFARFEITSGGAPVSNTASVTSSTPDPVTTNNSSTASTAVQCAPAATGLEPAAGATNVAAAGTLRWLSTSGTSYNVYLGPAGSGCTAATPFASTNTNFASYSGLQEGIEYEWRVEAVGSGCPNVRSACQRFTVGRTCTTGAPVITAPANGTVQQSPIHFTWSGTGVAGTTYQVFASVNGGASSAVAPATTALSLDATLPDGSISWYVVASSAGCAPQQSQTGTFTVCNPAAPVPSVIGEATSGQMYTVAWSGAEGGSYELQEATNAAFTDAVTFTVSTTSRTFRKTVTTGAQAFFYRVRGQSVCTQQFGAYSQTVRIVIAPPPSKSQRNIGVTVPAGSKEVVVQEVFVAGEPGSGVVTFSATVDKPWLTVRPQSGVLPPNGIILEVVTDPSTLPNGTFTGTVIVTLTTPTNSRGPVANGTVVRNVPVSISLVTPVSPVSASTPAANALVIPSIGHLDGQNSHWQSDIRITNTSVDRMQYLLTFRPAGGDANSSRQTTIDVEGGNTTALDDIVRNWYGIGSAGDSANGVLQITPVSTGSSTPADSRVTVASSRTYNVTANGTLGQYIPAVPFASFIGRSNPDGLQQVLSLQQIAQTSSFRTNVGLVEASGNPATVAMSVFDSTGVKIDDFHLELMAGEQRQMNAFLAERGITNFADGRIEVRVTGGDGRVTAYASVVDGVTNDPLLVSGVPLGQAGANRYVLPGVADLNVGIANWRTDMRVFNSSSVPQLATLSFFPQNGGETRTSSVVLNPGEVRTLDNVLQSTFGITNDGGALHVSTPVTSNLVVTGRTYNMTANGTYGQFVPAVTAADAVGSGDRALQIQQVEDSVRFRTNVGFAEVTGNDVEVEVSVILPDSRVTPRTTFTLPANSFRQMPVIRDFGLGNVYNARVAVRVIGGSGRITAYGSVIDMETQDPTYVPAQ